MASIINTQHQPPGGDEEEEGENDEEEEEEEEEGEEEDEEDEEEDDADFQISASSSAPGPLPLLPQADTQPISAAPSIPPPPPPPQSTSRAIIPFTGSFPAVPSFSSSKPPIEALAGSHTPNKVPMADSHSQLPTVSNSSTAKLGIKPSPVDADREPQRKVEGREHKKRSKNWTRAETLTLISLRTELAPRFAKAGRKSELWDEIAESMQKGPFCRDAQQCRDKWEKLMAGYKEVRDGIKHKDDNPYYEDLHPLLSGRVLKREREQDIAHDYHSAKTEPLKPTIAMDAAKLPPPPLYHPPVRNLAVDGHTAKPFKSVLLDSHYPPLTSLSIDGHHHHQHTSLKTAMDVKLHRPSILDGLPFRSSHAEAHYSRPTVVDHRAAVDQCAASAGDDEASEEQSHLQKRRKGSKLLSITDLHAVQSLLESVLMKQQMFFKELLDGIERKEELREQMRREREEKWRAEERAQRVFFAEAMQILTQKLGINNGIVEPSTMGVAAPVPANCMPPVSSPTVGNPCLKKRSKNWKRSEVLQLIKLRGEMEEKFVKSSRRAALWGELAEALSSQGIRRDGKQCREKWDKLMAEYKDVVDGKKQKGDSPYFPELQAALAGGGPDNQSNANVSGSSSKEEVMNT